MNTKVDKREKNWLFLKCANPMNDKSSDGKTLNDRKETKTQQRQGALLWLTDVAPLSLGSFPFSSSVAGFKHNITWLQFVSQKQLHFEKCLLTLVTSEKANLSYVLLRGLEFD